MIGARKRIQVRRCQTCQRVGHNQATCPEPKKAVDKDTLSPNRSARKTKRQTKMPSVSQPLKFFVHHVDYQPQQSPHLLNLKKETRVWDNVTASSPEKNAELYHTYHESPLIDEPASLPGTVSLLPADDEEEEEPAAWRKKISGLVDGDSLKDKFRPVAKALFSKQRLALISALLLISVIIPGPALSYYQNLVITKDTLIRDSTDAITALQDSTIALKQADLAAAEQATDQALTKFQTVLDQLSDKRFLRTVASILPNVGGSLESREKILLAGQEITLGNGYLLDGIKRSQNIDQPSLTARMNTILEGIHTSLPFYEQADRLFADIDSDSLPFEHQAQFNDYKKLFTSIVKDFKTIDELGTTLLEIFGGSGQRRYLLIFQNPHELRATGGFAGSFAIIDIKNGEIVNLDIPAGGTYDLQGQLKKFIEPPTPLLISNKRWEFQDANWFPDFPTTAEKTLWFYRHSHNVTADGVIAINATVLERLLSIVGPFIDAKRGLTLDSETAIVTLQKVVEEGPEKKVNKPKQILSDAAPEIIKSIKSLKAANILPLLNTMQEALKQKEIQVYFTDDETQNTINDFGWSGRILPSSPKQDYLMVVNSNIQGQKSDAKIEQSISHQAVVSPDGTVIATVVVTREHLGDKGEKLYGQTNIDYLRLYVPEGSELLSASGFTWPDEKSFRAPEKWYAKDEFLAQVEQNEHLDAKTGTRITTEFNKTTFGNWVITEPGETSQVQFTYRLPFKITAETKTSRWEKVVNHFKKELAEYQLLVQRQSGSKTTFESRIIFPNNWQTSWQEGDGLTLATNGARIAPRPLIKDTVWSLIMER